MEITVKGHVRDVTVDVLDVSKIKGHVGKAFFYWNKAQYDEPIIRIKDVLVTDTIKVYVKGFIEEYLRVLMTPKETTLPLLPIPENVETPVTKRQKRIASISGVPLWALKRKVLTLCHCKHREDYWRHTRYAQEDEELVKQYVIPYCCHCIYRETCEETCSDPATKSTETIERG